MTVSEEFKKWKDTNDESHLHSAFRDAMVIQSKQFDQEMEELEKKIDETKETKEKRMEELKEIHNQLTDIYNEKKAHPSDERKLNTEFDRMLPDIELFIQSKIQESESFIESYDDEKFQLPTIPEPRERK